LADAEWLLFDEARWLLELTNNRFPQFPPKVLFPSGGCFFKPSMDLLIPKSQFFALKLTILGVVGFCCHLKLDLGAKLSFIG